MAEDYHHSVMENATPGGEFTKWCKSGDNEGVSERYDRKAVARTRRENLARLIERDFAGNKSAFGRACNPPRSQSYISDLINNDDKPFAEEAAWNCEQAGGLLEGQLSVPDSPLKLDPKRAGAARTEIQGEIDDLEKDTDLEREVLFAIREIKARFKRVHRRKAG